MADPKHIAKLKAGPKVWNEWRTENPDIRPDLRKADFETEIHTYTSRYDLPTFEGFDLSRADLHGISARNSFFGNCSFDESQINFSDLCFSSFSECTFKLVKMRVTRIGSAHFNNCLFEDTDLSYCSAEETDFSNSKILGCTLNNMRLVRTDFSNAKIADANVYGISAWDLILDGSTQRNIIFSDDNGAVLTLDNIEIAQFLHILIKSSKIRSIIDTITSKVVLILGRFSPKRKAVLDEFRTLLRANDYVPIVFDFDKPKSRDLTETVSTLAHLSRFVIADITDPKSVPHELMQIVPQLPSVPVHPIIAEGGDVYGMFEHWKRYQWVLKTAAYCEGNIADFAINVIKRCEKHLAEKDRQPTER